MTEPLPPGPAPERSGEAFPEVPGASPPGGADRDRPAGTPGFKKILGVSLGLLFVLFLTIYVRDHLDDFAKVLERPVPPWAPALLALSVFLTYCANARAVRLTLIAHSLEISGTENLALTLATSAANTFLPFKGAAALRAYYLKSRHGLPVADFLSQSFLVSLAALACASLSGLAGLLAMRGLEPGPALALECYFAGTFLAAVALVFSGRLPVSPPGRLGALWRSWGRYRERPGLLARVAMWDAAFFLLWCASNYLALRAFGAELGPAEALFWAGGQVHTLLINLTPAGLGVMEAWSVFAGQAAGFAPAEALLAQGLFRLETFAVLGAAGVWGWVYLARLNGRAKPGRQRGAPPAASRGRTGDSRPASPGTDENPPAGRG